MTAIFPAFNEEVSIGSIVLRTHQHAHRVIVVDDGSTDRTAQVDEMAGGEIKIKPQMNVLLYLSVDCEAGSLPHKMPEIICCPSIYPFFPAYLAEINCS